MSVCIEFKDVSYAYPLTNKAAVKHLNFKLESGKCYGIMVLMQEEKQHFAI